MHISFLREVELHFWQNLSKPDQPSENAVKVKHAPFKEKI